MSYLHFTTSERKCLQDLLALGCSFRKIADYLGKSPSSVSREVRRNCSLKARNGKSDNPFNYNFWRAANLAIRRRRETKHYRLKPYTEEWNYIIWGLSQYWSPEEIVNRWRKENAGSKPFGVSTIYRYIKEKKFPNISRKTHLRRRGKKIQPRNANYNTIKPDRIIPEWPQDIKNRL